jgi:2,3,4,5-tetrahydropyridine-2-carboxylate N-succinyltransferase
LFYEFQDALNEGRVRAAQPDALSATGWRVNAWVKKGILLGFRMGWPSTCPSASSKI